MNYNLEKSPETTIIIEFAKELHPKNIFEAGCNYGRELWYLQGLAPLYGIDSDEDKINFAKTYVDGTFKVADATSIPYKDNKFELVYSSGVLAHSPPEKAKDIMYELYSVSSKYILLVEYIGSHLSRTSVGNCKQNTWIHDYNKLVSTLDVVVKYNEKVFFGSDCFQVMLLKKEIPKVEKFIQIEKIPQERKFEIKIGKFRVGF
jgi:SAM-dependent methyltransferase